MAIGDKIEDIRKPMVVLFSLDCNVKNQLFHDSSHNLYQFGI